MKLNELIQQHNIEDESFNAVVTTKESENIKLKKAIVEEQQNKKLAENELEIAKKDIIKLESELQQESFEKERSQTLFTQNEIERVALKTQLSENVEKVASLEIQLMELKCLNDGLIHEIDLIKDQQRQSGYKLQEVTVSRDMMEKRLTEALKNSQIFQTNLKEREEKLLRLTETLHSLEDFTEHSQDVPNRNKHEAGNGNELESTETLKKVAGKMESLKQSSQSTKTISFKQKGVGNMESAFVSILSENEILKKQLESSDQQLNSLAKSSAVLEEKLAAATNEVDKKKKQLEKVEEKFERDLKKTQELQKKNQEHENQLKDSQDKINSLTGRIKQAEETSQLEKKKTEQLERNHEDLVLSCKRQQDEINKERTEKDKLKILFNDNKDNMRELCEKIAAQLEEIDDLKKQHKDELKTNQKLRNDLENNANGMQSLEEIQINLKLEEQEIGTKQNQIESLEKELESTKRKNDDLRIKVKDLTQQLVQSREETLSGTQTIKKLEIEIQAFKENERRMKEELHELQKKIAALDDELNSTKSKNTELHRLAAKSNHLNLPAKNRKDHDKRNKQPNITSAEKTLSLNKNEKKEQKNNTEGESKLQTVRNEGQNQDGFELEMKLNNKKDNNKVLQQAKEEKLFTTTSTKIKVENDGLNSNNECKSEPNKHASFSCNLQNSFSSSSETKCLETGFNESDDFDQKGFTHNLKDLMETKMRQMTVERLLLESKTASLTRDYLQLEKAWSLSNVENKKLENQLADSKKEIIQLTILNKNTKQTEGQTLSSEITNLQGIQEKAVSCCWDKNVVSVTNAKVNHISRKDLNIETTDDRTLIAEAHFNMHVQRNQDDQILDKEKLTVATQKTNETGSRKGLSSIDQNGVSDSLALNKTLKKSLTSASRVADLRQNESMGEELRILREERESLIEELHLIREKKNKLESDLLETKKASLKLQEDRTFIFTSYKQEKESLLNKLEMNKSEVKNLETKLNTLNESKSVVEDLQQKNQEAEKIISELKKELVEKCISKNGLENDLLECKTKVKELLEVKTRFKVLSCENEDMSAVINPFKKCNSEKEFKESSTQTETANAKHSVYVHSFQKSVDENAHEENASQPNLRQLGTNRKNFSAQELNTELQSKVKI